MTDSVKLNADQQALLARCPDIDPRFIPNSWNGAADLDEKYHRAEQAFKAKETKEKRDYDIAQLEARIIRKLEKQSFNRVQRIILGEIIEKLLTEIKEHKGMTFAGIWRAEKAYSAGSVVVDKGASWHANVDVAGVRPGDGACWTLIAKGRGSR